MSIARVPLNVFGIGFGLAGLATTWRIADRLDLAPHGVSDVLFAIMVLLGILSVLNVYLFMLPMSHRM